MAHHPKEGLTRRNLLKSAAALLATNDMPARELLPVLERVTAEWPAEWIKAAALVEFCVEGDDATLAMFGKLAPFHAVSDITSDALQQLSLDWERNLSAAASHLEISDKLRKAIAGGMDMPPKSFFALLERQESRKEMAGILFERETGFPFKPEWKTTTFPQAQVHSEVFAFHEDAIHGVGKLATHYPSLMQADSMNELVTAMRLDIANALKLPLKNGCLDRIAAREGISHLRQLLDLAPELFPEGKLETFKRLAADLAQNGKQTITLEELEASENTLHRRLENAPFRLGYTPLQEKAQWIEDNRNGSGFAARVNKDAEADRKK